MSDNATIDSLTAAAVAGELSRDQINAVAEQLLIDDPSTVEDRVSFLKALATRGETPEEIGGLAAAFLDRAVDPQISPADLDGPTLDVCGTGGDKLDLFNVSTAGIFILAAGGVKVVKHGNRSITSNCGSADVLETLGMPIDLPPEGFAESMKRHGVGFLFAQMYHPAFKAVVPVRQRLATEGIRTVFNLLGPLLNPVRPDFQLVGVFDKTLPPVFARILAILGRKVAWAVHGETADGRGVDEISTMGPTQIHKAAAGTITEEVITPADLIIQPATVEQLKGSDAITNAGLVRGVLDGSDKGPRRDIVCLNAAAGFAISGLAGSLPDGFQLANEIIDRGQAINKLKAVTSV